MALSARERNKRSYDKHKAEGKCQVCGKPQDRKGSMCKKCLEIANANSRFAWADFQATGICPRCRTNAILGDEKVCPECRAKRAESVNKLRANDNGAYNAYMREYNKNRRKMLIEKGICPTCGKRKADGGYKTCGICRNKARVAKAKQTKGKSKREYWIEHNLCRFCGKPNVKGLKVCEEHRRKLSEISNSPKAKEARKEIQRWWY